MRTRRRVEEPVLFQKLRDGRAEAAREVPSSTVTIEPLRAREREQDPRSRGFTTRVLTTVASTPSLRQLLGPPDGRYTI